MTSVPPGIHVEHLFTTTIGVETPPAGTIDRSALLVAAVAAIPADGSQSTHFRGDAAGSALERASVPLMTYTRTVVDRLTVDTRTGAVPQWQVRGTLHRGGESAQLELPPQYDAFWTALYILDDGFAEPRTDDGDTGGGIRFSDPRLPGPMMEAPSLRLRMGLTPAAGVYAPDISVRPASGQIFIFPSWLRVRQDARATPRPRWLIELAFVSPGE